MSDTRLPLISIVLPCRNEALALGACLEQIAAVITGNNLSAEVIVSDSSTDRSPEIARQYGARLVSHGLDGYGNACREGLRVARGQYIFLADADGTYDFRELPHFLAKLQAGDDLVIGNRFAGTIDRGAMPWLNRWVGNPLLSALFRLLFRSRLSDIQCGARAFSREAFSRLYLCTTGMEFASELLIKATRQHFRITELPINYHCRSGQSKLRRLPDGWRHLRFMLLYSPLFLFFLPGIILFTLGAASLAYMYFDTVTLIGLVFQYHPMFMAALMVIVGYQLMLFAFFAKTYAITHLNETEPLLNFLHRHFTIEKAGAIGAILGIGGMALYVLIFWKWWSSGFGELHEVKNAIVALTLVVLSIQTVSGTFMLSILGIKNQ